MLIIGLLILVLISMMLNLRHYFSLKNTFTSINNKYQSKARIQIQSSKNSDSMKSDHDRLQKISNQNIEYKLLASSTD